MLLLISYYSMYYLTKATFWTINKVKNLVIPKKESIEEEEFVLISKEELDYLRNNQMTPSI